VQWISSYGQDNSANDNSYYNVDQIQYIAFGLNGDDSAYEVGIGTTDGGITNAVIYNGYATLADAQAKAQELANTTGGSARWVSSYGQDNASNTAYYIWLDADVGAGDVEDWLAVERVEADAANVGQVQAVTFEAHDSAYAVVLYVTTGGVSAPQYIYTGYATLADAQIVAQAIITVIGGEVS
jgi:hypothetical protein